ncbi:hypothetical protein D043_4939, partial [Vibrio parahaemolyticus EKP-021]
MIDGFYISNKV